MVLNLFASFIMNSSVDYLYLKIEVNDIFCIFQHQYNEMQTQTYIMYLECIMCSNVVKS